MQVYNEQIRDLLANVGPLAVREDSSKGVVVQGLSLHQVSKVWFNPILVSSVKLMKKPFYAHINETAACLYLET